MRERDEKKNVYACTQIHIYTYVERERFVYMHIYIERERVKAILALVSAIAFTLTINMIGEVPK